MMFGYEDEKLKELNAFETSREILQQPEVWRKTCQLIKARRDSIKEFLKDSLDQNTRIIFTGAGTSGYIGDTIKSFVEACTGCRTEAVATTDIVAIPEETIDRGQKTLLVSFARSGNSPESIGAYEIMQNNTDSISHIIITCNKEGELVKKTGYYSNNYIFLLPEETNDKGFAMTSSFTCMMLAALLIFDIGRLEENTEYVDIIARQGQTILAGQWQEIKKLSDTAPKRVVYLGTGCFGGLIRELSLKNMELTNGRIATLWETVLGFRHGPKTFMDNHTDIIVLMSENTYTNRYHKDLIREIHEDMGEHKLIVFSCQRDPEIEEICDSFIAIEGEKLPEIFLTFNYTLLGQLFALFNSLRLGIQPDNPSPDGIVNRVVKGVILHSYEG